MAKISFVLIVCFFCLGNVLFAQQPVQEDVEIDRNAFTLGILQGGGALIGFDYEVLVTKRFGLQAGAGLGSMEGALNFHLKPGARSSFLSVTYWKQGFGPDFKQDLIAGSIVYRSPKWFTGQIGIGKTLHRGPGFPTQVLQPNILLIFSGGVYLSF